MDKLVINDILMYSVDEDMVVSYVDKPCYRVGINQGEKDNLLVYFPIDSLQNKRIINAQLKVYVYSSGFVTDQMPVLNVFQIESLWNLEDQDEVTIINNDGSNNKIVYNKGFITFNITTIVRNWVEYKYINHGLLIMPQENFNSYVKIRGGNKVKNYLSKVTINYQEFDNDYLDNYVTSEQEVLNKQDGTPEEYAEKIEDVERKQYKNIRSRPNIEMSLKNIRENNNKREYIQNKNIIEYNNNEVGNKVNIDTTNENKTNTTDIKISHNEASHKVNKAINSHEVSYKEDKNLSDDNKNSHLQDKDRCASTASNNENSHNDSECNDIEYSTIIQNTQNSDEDECNNIEEYEVITLDNKVAYSKTYIIEENEETSFFVKNNGEQELPIMLELSPDEMNYFNHKIAFVKAGEMIAFRPDIHSKAARIRINTEHESKDTVDLWYLAKLI